MKKEMIKKLEGMLYNFKIAEIEIDNLKIDLEMLKGEYKGVNGISYNEKSSVTNKFNSSVENEIIKKEEKIALLESNIIYKEGMYRKIKNALEVLDERETEFIKLFYLQNYSYMSISEAMNMSYSYVYDYKMVVLNKIAPLVMTINVP